MDYQVRSNWLRKVSVLVVVILSFLLGRYLLLTENVPNPWELCERFSEDRGLVCECLSLKLQGKCQDTRHFKKDPARYLPPER